MSFEAISDKECIYSHLCIKFKYNMQDAVNMLNIYDKIFTEVLRIVDENDKGLYNEIKNTILSKMLEEMS